MSGSSSAWFRALVSGTRGRWFESSLPETFKCGRSLTDKIRGYEPRDRGSNPRVRITVEDFYLLAYCAQDLLRSLAAYPRVLSHLDISLIDFALLGRRRMSATER